MKSTEEELKKTLEKLGDKHLKKYKEEMTYTDETRLPFGNEQVKGEKLEDISNHWFKTFWKFNDDWYLSVKEDYGENPFKTIGSYSYQRFEVMAYIEENFDPNEL